MSASGKKGTRIQLRYGELLHPDGSLNVMTSVAGQIKRQGPVVPAHRPLPGSRMILSWETGRWYFEPAFTFHGFVM